MNPEEFLQRLRQATPGQQLTMLLLFVLIFVACLCYYRTLQRTMQTISPELRPLHPASIWLALVPFVGNFWYMFYIIKLSLALQKEMAKRNKQGTGAIGVSMAVVALFMMMHVPSLVLMVTFPTLALLVLHWQRMALHRKLLAEPVYLVVE